MSLSNSDFRALLSSKKADGGGEKKPNLGTKEIVKLELADAKKQKDKQKAHKNKPKPIKIKEKEKEEEAAAGGLKYRDRAKERREGKDLDYAEVNTTGLSAEYSKFLGGDIDHTHLVKGLDYALYEKNRQDMLKLQAEERLKQEKEAQKSVEPAVIRSVIGRAIHHVLFSKADSATNRKTELFLPGRMTYQFNLDTEWNTSQDLPTVINRSSEDCPQPPESITANLRPDLLIQLSKIMSYVKQGSRKVKRKDATASNVPKAETAVVAPSKSVPAKPVVAVKPIAADEDIFADVGTYDPTNTTKGLDITKDKNKPSAPAVGAMLSAAPATRTDDDMDIDTDEKPMMSAPTQDYGVTAPYPSYDVTAPYPSMDVTAPYPSTDFYYSGVTAPYHTTDVTAPYPYGYVDPALEANQQRTATDLMSQQSKERSFTSLARRDDDTMRKRRETDAREKDPAFVSDSYAECYPGFTKTDAAFEAYDSEEEDISKMDTGNKKTKTMRRSDFETEEQWERYNLNREALPKAAFQFGVKMNDGRKTRRSKTQKMNSELQKIENLMEQRDKQADEAERSSHKRQRHQ